MIKVSIIIPCFNSSKYLRDTLTSIVSQTFKDYEVVIVNDGSTDSTISICQDFFENKEIDYLILDHKENLGAGFARNTGILHCSGEYIVALDSDDLLHRDFLKHTVEVLESNPKVGLVFTLVKSFGTSLRHSNSEICGMWSCNHDPDLAYILAGNPIQTCPCFRKKVWLDVSGYDPNKLIQHEDWEFYIRVKKYGWSFHLLPLVLVYYRVHEDSSYSSKNEEYFLATRCRIILKHHTLYSKLCIQWALSYLRYNNSEHTWQDIRLIAIYFLYSGVLNMALPFFQELLSQRGISDSENTVMKRSLYEDKFFYSVCLISTNKILEAIDLLNELINFAPKSYYLWAYMGISHCLNGNLECALGCMKESLAQASNSKLDLPVITALYKDVCNILQIPLSSPQMRYLRHAKTIELFNKVKSLLKYRKSFYLEPRLIDKELLDTALNKNYEKSTPKSISAKCKNKYILDFLQGVPIYEQVDIPFPLIN